MNENAILLYIFYITWIYVKKLFVFAAIFARYTVALIGDAPRPRFATDPIRFLRRGLLTDSCSSTQTCSRAGSLFATASR